MADRETEEDIVEIEEDERDQFDSADGPYVHLADHVYHHVSAD